MRKLAWNACRTPGMRMAVMMMAIGVLSAIAAGDWAEIVRQRRNWWSLQPVRKPVVADSTAGAGNAIDCFILAKLKAAGLHQAPAADRTTMARRLSYVLTGLPPKPQEIQRFENDGDANAYERLVDSLLCSPHFGETWARHWMDVVRYCDTYGYEWDIPAKGAWRYRDYLIRAFNADVPYDQLVREQIAGDLLDSPRIDAVHGINESKIGTMFF